MRYHLQQQHRAHPSNLPLAGMRQLDRGLRGITFPMHSTSTAVRRVTRCSRTESMQSMPRGASDLSQCDSPAVEPVFSDFFAKTVRKS